MQNRYSEEWVFPKADEALGDVTNQLGEFLLSDIHKHDYVVAHNLRVSKDAHNILQPNYS